MIIEQIILKSEKKTGEPYKREGKFQKRVSVKIGGVWYGNQVYLDDEALMWQEGQDVAIEVYEKDGFKNWKHIRGSMSYPTKSTSTPIPSASKSGTAELILAKLEAMDKKLDKIFDITSSELTRAAGETKIDF